MQSITVEPMNFFWNSVITAVFRSKHVWRQYTYSEHQWKPKKRLLGILSQYLLWSQIIDRLRSWKWFDCQTLVINFSFKPLDWKLFSNQLLVCVKSMIIWGNKAITRLTIIYLKTKFLSLSLSVCLTFNSHPKQSISLSRYWNLFCETHNGLTLDAMREDINCCQCKYQLKCVLISLFSWHSWHPFLCRQTKQFLIEELIRKFVFHLSRLSFT